MQRSMLRPVKECGKIRSAARTAGTLVHAFASHYRISFAAGTVLQAAAFVAAWMERGYFGLGSEILVLPMVVLIGMQLTPELEITFTESGVEITEEK